MTKRVSDEVARERLADLLGEVANSDETIIVEKAGRPVAVLISPEQYERYLGHLESRFAAAVEEIRHRNERRHPNAVQREVSEIVKLVRRERLGR